MVDRAGVNPQRHGIAKGLTWQLSQIDGVCELSHDPELCSAMCDPLGRYGDNLAGNQLVLLGLGLFHRPRDKFIARRGVRQGGAHAGSGAGSDWGGVLRKGCLRQVA